MALFASRRARTSACAALVAGALVAVSVPATDGHVYDPWTAVPQRYEGATKGGEHLDATVSGNGREVVQVALTTRARCTGVGAKRQMVPFKPPPGLYGFKPARVGANGRFGWIVTTRSYHGAPSRTTVLGQLLDGGARMRVRVTRNVNHDFYSVGKRQWIPGRCISKTVLTAIRWSSADWVGTTSQQLPLRFHVAGFTTPGESGDLRAAITSVQTSVRAACDNGQTITRDVDIGGAQVPDNDSSSSAADNGFTSSQGMTGDTEVSLSYAADRLSLGGKVIWAVKGRVATGLTGTLRFSAYMDVPDPTSEDPNGTTTVTCEASGVKFTAQPVG